MVDMILTQDGQNPSEHFVGSGRQTIPFTGYRGLEPGDILGTASAPLFYVPLETLASHDAHNGVTHVAESPIPSACLSLDINAKPDTLDEPSSKLLRRLNDDQRKSFIRLWHTVPSHIRRIDFALDFRGWDPSATDALSETLTEYSDIFSLSKLDYGACSLRLSEIKVSPGTLPIQSRPYRLNPVLAKQADASGLLLCRWPQPLLHVRVVQPPRMRSNEIRRHSHHNQLSEN